METALKIIRRIFPFHAMKQKSEKGCLDFQLGRCPGPYAGAITKEDYAKNIRGIKMILEGKKKRLVTTLEKEMKEASKAQEFEKAGNLRNKIFALNHIRDVALITRDSELPSPQPSPKGRGSNMEENFRIEAYDISNISGQNAVGSMVVFSAKGGSASGGENGQPNKSQYRKFKIKTIVGSDDVGMMREVLSRRFGRHLTRPDYRAPSPLKGEGKKEKTFDWPMPDLILLDGGQGHVNMADKLLHQELGLVVPIVGVAKGPKRKNLELRISNFETVGNDVKNILDNKNLVKSIMDEAHRFAITFHRKLRAKNALK